MVVDYLTPINIIKIILIIASAYIVSKTIERGFIEPLEKRGKKKMVHTRGEKNQHWFGPFPFAHSFPYFMRKIARHIDECMGKFGSWVPYNLEDREEGYLITVPLPGRTKEDVTVSLIGNSLNIKASKPKAEGEAKDESGQIKHPFLRFFFTFMDVDMDIPLPMNADLDSIKSVIANGLLKVKIGKKPSKKIDIDDTGNN